MSKNGRFYLKEKSRKLNESLKPEPHPLIVFVKSWDFIGKLSLSSISLGYIIYSLCDNAELHRTAIVIMGITIALYPFAKKMTDDGLRHSVSKKSFEIIHGTGSRNFGLIYAFLVMVAAIPLGCVYLLYHLIKYRKSLSVGKPS
ncbi:hypothetical protein M988_1772 [Hafnia paralvei ATCC 29927]|jgi:hypothetical protein|uniref:hypothetical protein n=1 Tax=Hafnia TaxID=568 RepID=UPI000343EC79|nr:hypothetical protein [Hafnia paralvei]EPC06757.1 hypothetical protein HMPREF0864_04765 [Enterobacteriaceae bacterium 9_2_54FAA]MDU1192742.1 hypothetical protein [Enterobacteriaceae bacterium]AMH19031.1 hypothetical protein AL518_14070 [Hafnia paralvei]MBU2671079.1 hypothetical protein [Hafnia paralvei]MCE9881462.1 hypothetical protein [Hafnia paralvei]